jgi:hypothetical protein
MVPLDTTNNDSGKEEGRQFIEVEATFEIKYLSKQYFFSNAFFLC